MKRYTPPKKEFLMLPNSVFDMPLDVYAFKIYAYLVCCAGSRGVVETFVIAAAVHQAAGKLVDDDDLAVLHHIVDPVTA